MQRTHTPGPWILEPDDEVPEAERWTDIQILKEGHGYIAGVHCAEGVHLTSEDFANAAFIVRACNAHEELVNQLRLAQRMLLQTDWRLEEGFMAEIAAAIAKAEGRA